MEKYHYGTLTPLMKTVSKLLLSIHSLINTQTKANEFALDKERYCIACYELSYHIEGM